jgi:hypothetical protein
VSWPASLTGISTMQSRPMPRTRSARSMDPWRWSPVMTLIGGAPNRPRCSTSQPWRDRTAFRAAARQVTCAIWQPVTKAKLAFGGIPSNSQSQRPTTSSTTAAAGAGATENMPRVLIPDGSHPVGGECGRESASDDSAKKAPARIAKQPPAHVPHQLLDHHGNPHSPTLQSSPRLRPAGRSGPTAVSGASR